MNASAIRPQRLVSHPMLVVPHLVEALLAHPLRTPLAHKRPLVRGRPLACDSAVADRPLTLDSAVADLPALVPHGRLELPPSLEPSTERGNRFSLLSWNCLLPNGEDNWWCEKMYQAHVPEEARTWPHRKQLIRDRLLLADADIVCIQEAAGDTFESDFDFMHEHGYASVLHRKFRFRCATFYRPELFTLDAVSTEDRRTLGLAQALALALP